MPARNVASIVHNFGQGTSMHGVPNAIRARSTSGRVVWGCVCLLAASVFGLQLVQMLRKYFDNPKKVVIEMVPLSVPFPSISLCNMRNLDNIVLSRLNRIFKSEDNITAIMGILDEIDAERERDRSGGETNTGEEIGAGGRDGGGGTTKGEEMEQGKEEGSDGQRVARDRRNAKETNSKRKRDLYENKRGQQLKSDHRTIKGTEEKYSTVGAAPAIECEVKSTHIDGTNVMLANRLDFPNAVGILAKATRLDGPSYASKIEAVSQRSFGNNQAVSESSENIDEGNTTLVKAGAASNSSRGRPRRVKLSSRAVKRQAAAAPESSHLTDKYGIYAARFGIVENSLKRIMGKNETRKQRGENDKPGVVEKSPGSVEESPGSAEESPGSAEKSPNNVENSPGILHKTSGIAEKSHELPISTPHVKSAKFSPKTRSTQRIHRRREIPSETLKILHNPENEATTHNGKAPPSGYHTTLREELKLDAFIGHYMRSFAKYYPLFQKNDTDLHVLKTVMTRTTMATNLDRAVLAAAGVPFKEFVVTCRFGGEACNMTRDFAQFFDAYYYNCFTYRAPSDSDLDDEDSSLAEGLENGWSTTVLAGSSMLDQNERIRHIPGIHQYLSPMSGSEGVRVVIHPKDTEPYPHTEGFDVPPGYSASFGVKSRKNVRIGPPFGNCSDDNPFQDDRHNYRLVSCQKHCMQRAIVAACGCKDISLPGLNLYPLVRHCSEDSDIPEECRYAASDVCLEALYAIYDRFQCVRNVSARVARSNAAIRACRCFPPCSEVTYDVSYSLSRWPAESFEGEQAYTDIFETEEYHLRFNDPQDAEKVDLYGPHFDETNRRAALRDFARLNVYIADSNVLKTEEQEDYTTTQLLADIGGQLGLWVGVSVITLAEVFELIVDLVRYFGAAYGPYGRGRQFRGRRRTSGGGAGGEGGVQGGGKLGENGCEGRASCRCAMDCGMCRECVGRCDRVRDGGVCGGFGGCGTAPDRPIGCNGTVGDARYSTSSNISNFNCDRYSDIGRTNSCNANRSSFNRNDSKKDDGQNGSLDGGQDGGHYSCGQGSCGSCRGNGGKEVTSRYGFSLSGDRPAGDLWATPLTGSVTSEMEYGNGVNLSSCKIKRKRKHRKESRH